MLIRLIKWLLTTLFILVTGTLIGGSIAIIITEVPLWGLVAGFMIISVLAFKFAVWAIKGEDYV